MADLKLGLKLFSNQFDFYKNEAIEIIKNGYANYIELFVYPDSLDVLKDWKRLKEDYGIDFTIHSPHSSQNVNLVVPELLDYNKKIYSQMDIFVEELDADYMVIHSGRKGNIEEAARQLNIIKPKRMVIENTPYFSPKMPDVVAAGGTVEEIKFVMDEVGCEFCFDVGHAFCSAMALGKNPYDYMEEFNKLNPKCYHLSDGEIENIIDKHFHISKGDYDWSRIMKSLNKSCKMTLETITKNYNKSLFGDFVNDTKIIRGLCQE